MSKKMSIMNSNRDGYNLENIHASRDVIITMVNFGDHSRSRSMGRKNQARPDVFRPSFYTSPNPSEVLLDFGLSLDGTRQHTPEARVLREILNKDASEERTRILSIYGKAGVGKSCILRGLGDQRLRHKLQEHFPGGIYFLSLGMDATESTLIQGLAEITQMCGGEELAKELRDEENLRIAVKKVRGWMGGRKCLVLMDDFWKRNGLGEGKVREVGQIFDEGSGSVLVMTTRFIDLATLGVVVEVEERDTMSKEAEAILLKHAKFEREELEDEEEVEAFYKVLKMCGGLPLFLSVAGRGVAHLSQGQKRDGSERKPVWMQYWEMLEAMGQNELMDTEHGEYPDLTKTLRLSLELLSERLGKRPESLSVSKFSFEEMHRALCVFKKQERIPISACRRLWNVKSNEAALKIGQWFAGVGLADIEGRRLGEKHITYIRLHDLVHMFAMKCATEKGEAGKWHKELLEGYTPRGRAKKGVRKWWEICKEVCNEDGGDGYLFENVCRHLMRSGNLKELVGLLVSGEWSKLRHEVGGLSAWKGDLGECLEGLKKGGGSETEKETERGLEIVRDAVVESWTYVDENPEELGYQVFGRLIDCENKVVRRFLKSIEDVQTRPWLRPVQRCWDQPGKGMMIGEFDFSDEVWDIALHKKSFTAVVGFGEKVVTIDLKEMRVIAISAGHTKEGGKVGISGDGKRAFSWSEDGSVRQWNVESGEEHKDTCVQIDVKESDEEIDEGDWTRCAAFSPENDFVVTESVGGKIKIWNLCSGTRVGRTMDTFGLSNCIAMSPNGRIVAAGLWTGSVVLYDVETSRPLCGELKGHERRVRDIVFRMDGRVVASCGDDGTIRLWDLESKTQLGDPFVSCESPPYRVAFSEDGKQICSVGRHGSMSVWDMANGAETRSWKAHTFEVNCVALIGNAGSRWAVSGGGDGTVRVWDLQGTPDGGEERIYHKDAISCVAASPDGSFFVSGSEDQTLRIWDGVDGRPDGEALCGHEDVTSVAVSPDGRRVVSGSWDGSLRVWDVRTRTQVGDALRVHERAVNCVAYSPNGEFVVSGSDDQTARVWRVMDYRGSARSVGTVVRTWQSRLNRFLQHVAEVASRWVRVAGPEADEGLRHREALRLEMTLRPALADGESDWRYGMSCIAVSRDGQRVLAGSKHGEIFVWDMDFGRCLDRKQSHIHRALARMDISESNEVVAMNCRNEMSRWQLDNEGRLTRLLHGEEGIGVGQTESQEGCLSRVFGDVLCRGRTVELCCGGQKIATLPDRVDPELWTYNAKSRMLCIGFDDGRVFLFRVVW